MMLKNVRPPAVAGSFYPDDRDILAQMVSGFISTRRQTSQANPACPIALIVPHAGYIYSASIAACAYSLLLNHKQHIKRVLLLGPSHHVGFKGVASSSCQAFNTPLGDIKQDQDNINHLLDLELIKHLDQAHAQEHSLEVQLPFLQTVLDDFSLIALVVGQAQAKDLQTLFEYVAKLDHTLVVISTDLSHFHSYEEAQIIDSKTNDAILNFDSNLMGEQACGCHPLNGFLLWAKKLGLNIENLDLKNSGDTAGPKDRVVGYGAYALYA